MSLQAVLLNDLCVDISFILILLEVVIFVVLPVATHVQLAYLNFEAAI